MKGKIFIICYMHTLMATRNTGLIFRKLDLHIHTPASRCFIDKTVTPGRIIESALNKELDAIAITDHNSGELIDQLKEAGKDKLIIFPGVEITCSGGGNIHIIALFDIDKTTKSIENFLGQIGITEDKYGKEEAFANKTPNEIIELVNDRGGLAILAHANSAHGVLCDMESQPRIQTIQNIHLLAAEATDFDNPSLKEKKKRVVDLLNGEDRDYNKKCAVYQSSDNPSSSEEGKHSLDGIGKRYTYFKLDEINLEGLRLCFCDPEVRIKQMGEYVKSKYPVIRSMEVSGGFLDKCPIKFHSGLNSILGGKGVGKSLIIEFLRFALCQVSSEANILKDNQGKLKNCLGDFQLVKIVVEQDDGQQYLIERTFNGEDNPITCTNLDTQESYKGDISKIFPILAYSQTEIIKIAENSNAQLELIDKFIDFNDFADQIKELSKAFDENNKKISDSISANRDIKQLDRDIETTNEQLKKINKTLKNQLFDEFERLDSKKEFIDTEIEYNKEHLEEIDKLKKKLEKPQKRKIPKFLEKDSLINKAVGISNESVKIIDAELDSLKDKLREEIKKLEVDFSEWLTSYDKKKKEYEEMIAKSGGEKSKLEQQRRRLDKKLKRLRKEYEAKKSLVDEFNKFRIIRNEHLDNLDNLYNNNFNMRELKYAEITSKSDKKLDLKLTKGGNKKDFETSLNELKRNSGIRKTDIEKITKTISPREFVDLVIDMDEKTLSRRTGLVKENALKIINVMLNRGDLNEFLRIQHSCYPKDVPSIRFKKLDGKYYPLENLSMGQKCTALLIIALVEGNMPVIIDQPEDSLDVPSIYEDIVKKLRENKEKRQFILTTHNSCVAVASDSDTFVILQGSSSNSNISANGAIDRQDVKKEVIKDLEGGENPYMLKSKKYNILK